MRAVVQRVSSASVVVAGETVGAIGTGLCVLVGVTHDDTEAVAVKLATKLVGLRIFEDDAGAMNRALADVDGGILVISQFTLYGDAAKGRRPSFLAAAPRPVAELRSLGVEVATGRFGEDMAVQLVNDGPTTILLEL